MKTKKIQQIRELANQPEKQKVSKEDMAFLKMHNVNPENEVAVVMDKDPEITARISEILTRLHSHKTKKINTFDVQTRKPNVVNFID